MYFFDGNFKIFSLSFREKNIGGWYFWATRCLQSKDKREILCLPSKTKSRFPGQKRSNIFVLDGNFKILFPNKNYVGGRNFWLHCKDKKSFFFQAKEKASKAKNCFPEDKNFQINIFWMETQKYCHQPCLSNSDKELRMFAEQRQKEMRKQARPKLFTQGQNLSRFAFSAD